MGRIERALVSVSDKTDLIPFVSGLVGLGIQILSTGGTATYLHDAGISVIGISDITHFPEMLDGRVKTLHPNVHGGILADRSKPEHMQTLQEHHIQPIDLVVINLYPFVATIQEPNVTLEDAIENIDIGGPAMIRSASKNHQHVGVVTLPSDYQSVLKELKDNHASLSPETKRALAIKAFRHTSQYDTEITNYLEKTN